MLRCGGCVSAIELNHLDPPRLDGFANPILNLSWPPAAHRICGSFPVLFLLTGPWVRPSPGISCALIAEGHANVSLGRKPRREKADPYPQLLFDIGNQKSAFPGVSANLRASRERVLRTTRPQPGCSARPCIHRGHRGAMFRPRWRRKPPFSSSVFGAKSFSGPQAIIEAGISLGGQE
jgi:hypothetical protein